jgi:uncharacterized membrane protein YphA (DoxX/SURF4 family)
MEEMCRGSVRQAYWILRFAFAIIPIAAGVDKFFDFLVDWDQYLIPFFGSFGPFLMKAAGVVEVIAGLGVLIRPKLFANIVALWLLMIIGNLVLLGHYYDIALRDFGLMLGALALGRLAKASSHC